jgi:hypothetical protein
MFTHKHLTSSHIRLSPYWLGGSALRCSLAFAGVRRDPVGEQKVYMAEKWRGQGDTKNVIPLPKALFTCDLNNMVTFFFASIFQLTTKK